MTTAAQRRADRVFTRGLDRWLEQLESSQVANAGVHDRIAQRLTRELRGTPASHIRRIIRRVFGAFERDRLRVIEAAVQAAASAGDGMTPAVARAVFGDRRARAALRPSIAVAGQVARARIGGAGDAAERTLRAQLRTRTTMLAADMAAVVEESVVLSETTTELSERLLAARDIPVRIPKYIEEVRAAERRGGPNAVRATVRRQLRALERGRIAEHDISRQTRRFLERVERSGGADIDRAVDTWVRGRAQNQAMTIARTEGQTALNVAYVESTRDQPWVVGYRWNLSPAHEKPDICFPPGTLVTTPMGLVAIESLRPGDRVVSANGAVNVIAKVHRSSYAGPLHALRYRSAVASGVVSTTPSHPVATAHGWMRARDVRTGHRGFARPSPLLADGRQLPRGSAGTGRRDSPVDEPERATPIDAPALHGVSSAPWSMDIQGKWPGQPELSVMRWSGLASPFLHGPQLSGRRSSLGSRLPSYGCAAPLGLPALGDTARFSMSTVASNSGDASAPERIAHHTRGMSEKATVAASASLQSTGTGISSSMSSAAARPASHTQRRVPALRAALLPHSVWSTTVCASSGALRPLPSETGREVFHTSDTDAVGVELEALGAYWFQGEVWNLSVEGDASYYANGLAVHNCDVMAAQDDHSLGGGGYPKDEVPSLAHPNCIPPGHLVETSAGMLPIEAVLPGMNVLTHAGRWRPVLRLSKRGWSGELVVATIGKRRLVATPEHPVLTARGWQPADRLRPGDEVFVRLESAHGASAHGRINSDDSPSDSDEVGRLANVGREFTSSAVPVAGVDLNGEELGGQRCIDVELADSHLRHGRKTDDAQAMKDGLFISSRRGALFGARPAHQFREGPALATDGVVGRARHRKTLLGCPTARGDELLLPRASTLNPAARKPSVDRHARAAEAGSNLQHAEALHDVEVDDVVDIELEPLISVALGHFGIQTVCEVWRRAYVGPVHNFAVQGDESYCVSGVVAHNCMCFFTTVTDENYLERELARRRGEPEPSRPWVTDGETSGRQWLQSQPEPMRRQILGPGRAREFENRPTRVVNRDGSFNPLYTVQGRRPPPLPEGSDFQHRPRGSVGRLGKPRSEPSSTSS